MDAISQSVQQFYNEAGKYFSKSRQRRRGEDANWEEVKPYLQKLKPGDRVLDLGCGNGRLLTGIKVKVDYLGVDFSSTLLQEATQLHPQARFIQGDITSEQVWKNIGKQRFEAVFCIATLHHLPYRSQQLTVMKQIAKHLAEGGFAYISVWNLWQRRYLRHHLDVKTKMHNPRWVYIPFMNKWQRFCFSFNKAYLANLMIEAGLRIEKMFYAGEKGRETGWLEGRNLVAIGKK